MAVFWVVAPCHLVEVYRRFRGACCHHHALIIQAANTSETSANLYQTTRRINLEDSHHHTLRRENLKPHQYIVPHYYRNKATMDWIPAGTLELFSSETLPNWLQGPLSFLNYVPTPGACPPDGWRMLLTTQIFIQAHVEIYHHDSITSKQRTARCEGDIHSTVLTRTSVTTSSPVCLSAAGSHILLYNFFIQSDVTITGKRKRKSEVMKCYVFDESGCLCNPVFLDLFLLAVH
jgi:hypothetical protein